MRLAIVTLTAHGYGELLWNWFVRNKPPHANWDEPSAIAAPIEA